MPTIALKLGAATKELSNNDDESRQLLLSSTTPHSELSHYYSPPAASMSRMATTSDHRSNIYQPSCNALTHPFLIAEADTDGDEAVIIADKGGALAASLTTTTTTTLLTDDLRLAAPLGLIQPRVPKAPSIGVGDATDSFHLIFHDGDIDDDDDIVATGMVSRMGDDDDGNQWDAASLRRCFDGADSLKDETIFTSSSSSTRYAIWRQRQKHQGGTSARYCGSKQ